MNKYELVIIVDPNLKQLDAEDFNIAMDNKIKEFGNITEKEDLGTKKLAYEVKNKKEGHYIIYRFEISIGNYNNAIKEIERFCRIRDEVLKFLIVKL